MDNKLNNQLLFVLFIIDILTMCASYLIASLIRFGSLSEVSASGAYVEIIWVLISVYLLITVFSCNSSEWIYLSTRSELYRILEKHLYLIMIVLLYMFIIKKSDMYSRIQFVSFFVIDIILMFVVHTILKHIIIKLFKKTSYCERVLLITESAYAEDIIRRIRKTKNWYFRVKGIAILDKDLKGSQIEGIDVIADGTDYYQATRLKAFDSVIINEPSLSYTHWETIISQFVDMGIIVRLNIPEYDIKISAGRKLENMGLLGVVTYGKYEYNFVQIVIKRFMDICGGLVGMFFFGLAMLIFGPLIKIDSKGPILFKQQRIGKNGRVFEIYKFRSMYIDAEERKAELMEHNEMQGQMFKMKNDPRITRIGKILRKTSIDELPQFYNVLKGDMSLVGTRPPTVDEFNNYEPYQRKRISIKPGITGMWQVSGRSSITDFDDIVKLDCEYIDNWSVSKDIKILIKTVWVVLFGRGAE